MIVANVFLIDWLVKTWGPKTKIRNQKTMLLGLIEPLVNFYNDDVWCDADGSFLGAYLNGRCSPSWPLQATSLRWTPTKGAGRGEVTKEISSSGGISGPQEGGLVGPLTKLWRCLFSWSVWLVAPKSSAMDGRLEEVEESLRSLAEKKPSTF